MDAFRAELGDVMGGYGGGGDEWLRGENRLRMRTRESLNIFYFMVEGFWEKYILFRIYSWP